MKMKDKKADQTVKRKKHLENLKKSRRDEPILDRNEPSKLEKPTILIVCEGKNTEPSYFRQFKLSTATIKPIGEGYNTVSLVNRAKQLSEERTYEQVWCVFDKDDFSNTDFNNAVQIAEANKFGVAYSNQAFEYWTILHFNDHQGGGMNRNDYDDKINELLKDFGITYDGKSSKIITDEIFELLEGIDTKINKVRRDLAIERAKRNDAFFDHTNYAEEESSTMVFKLVEELIKYI
jgi:hypothetical protein